MSVPLSRLFLNQTQLPLVLQPDRESSPASFSKDHLCEYLRERAEDFDQLLLRYGAILLRGFELRDANDFSDVLAAAFGDRPATDQPNALANENRRGVATDGNKTRVLHNVYTSTEQPPQHRIPQHNEDCFTRNPPQRILFFCETPPTVGGETPLASTRQMYDRMDDEILDLFEQHQGVTYVRFYWKRTRISQFKSGNVAFKTWQDVFGTDDPEEVERLCSDNGIEYCWNQFGALQTKIHLPAVAQHPVTGESVWFNQIHIFNPTRRLVSLPVYMGYLAAKWMFAPKRFTFATFGDGTPIPNSIVNRIHEAFEQLTVKFKWQQGDLLVVDNYSTSHGRMPFQGPRRILAGMR